MKKNQPNKFIRFTGIAFQMGATIYLGNFLGLWLDDTYANETGTYSKIVTLLAVFLAIYSVIKQVTKLTKDD